MVQIQPASLRKEKVLRTKEYCEIAVEAVTRHLTPPINGSLQSKTIIRSLVGMSTNNLVHSISSMVERLPGERSVRYHLSKLDLESLQKMQSNILEYSQDTILKLGKSYRFTFDFTNDPYYGTVVETNHDYVKKSRHLSFIIILNPKSTVRSDEAPTERVNYLCNNSDLNKAGSKRVPVG